MTQLTTTPANTIPYFPLAFLAVGSHNDDPKVAECKRYLEEAGIFVFDGVKSIHRTPHALEEMAERAPFLPKDAQQIVNNASLSVRVIIWAAGWAAHLPGWVATNNFYTPVIALPVWSDTFGKVFGAKYAKINAFESMHDMPPEVPNGLASNPKNAAKMAEKIIKLDIPEWYNKVAIPEWVNIDPAILESLWLEVDLTSPIQIVLQDIDDENFSVDPTKIQIIIPTAIPVWEGKTRDIGGTLNKLDAEWLYMGWQVGNINYLNALIFVGQILASHGNGTIQEKLIERRDKAKKDVLWINKVREEVQAKRLKQIMRLHSTWLWPMSKQMNHSRGDERLESLGYVRFYKGKNADLYIIPDREPLEILMVRTDRTSVFNIPLDLEIEGKWAIQTQISIQWTKFAESRGIKTAMRKLPDNIPAELRGRSQAIELCRQVEIELWDERWIQWMELIFRNYITGSLFKAYQKWENPYEIDLPKWLKEWSKITDTTGNGVFTPTDKTTADNPIPSKIVEIAYPEIVAKLQVLFREFTDFAYENGYIIVDTKFEVFLNSKWEWVIGDEILTPESSRWILRSDFEAETYVSADKQIIRNIGKRFDWEKRWEKLQVQDPTISVFPVGDHVTDADRKKVLSGYTSILNSLT
jgi:phosphoribosylaminoimidazole-succinocarboxamide synthase